MALNNSQTYPEVRRQYARVAAEGRDIPIRTGGTLRPPPIENAGYPIEEPLVPDEYGADQAIDQGDRANVQWLMQAIQAPNVAELLDAETLAEIGDKVVREYRIDKDSRSEWETRNELAMKLAKQTIEKKSEPWPGAANTKIPLITTACIQFAARAYPAIVQGRDVVKGQVIGEDPDGQKRSRADRIGQHMSWQLTAQMEEWEEDTDRLLHALPLLGVAFRKTYFDSGKQRNCSEYVSAEHLVVNQSAKSLETAPRATELKDFYPHEIVERQRDGRWREVDLGMPDGQDDDAPHRILEQHRMLDLDRDGYAEPYVVTVHEERREVLRIVARFDQEGVEINQRGQVARIKPVHYYTKYQFLPAVDGTFYEWGLGQLLAPINDNINAVTNQLLDAGALANSGGGFINSALSIKSGTIRFKLGEWKLHNFGSITNPILPMPRSEPSPVLFNLLGLLIEFGKEVANIKDILSGENTSATMPATTTLALIEQGQTVYTAIYKRIFRALKIEFGKLYRLNGIYLDPKQYFTVMDTPQAILRADYMAGDADVVPVADPTVVTSMQRMGQAAFLSQYRDSPVVDQQELIRREMEAARIPDVDRLVVADRKPTGEELAVLAKLETEKRKADAEIALSEADRMLREEDMLNKRADTLLKLAQVEKTMAEAQATSAGPALEFVRVEADLIKADLSARTKIKQMQEKAEDGAAGEGGVGGVVAGPNGAGVPQLPGGPPGGVAANGGGDGGLGLALPGGAGALQPAVPGPGGAVGSGL